MLTVAAQLPGVSFLAADLPHTVDADRTETAHLLVRNTGLSPLTKTNIVFGCHWYYLDGTERRWDSSTTSVLAKDVLPAASSDLAATFHTPKQPGRYALVWDARSGDGPWQSALPVSAGDDILQNIITVTGKGSAVPVDLTKAFNTVGIGANPAAKNGGFDGHGSVLPAELLPPDATAEVEGDPLLQGKPGPPLYPSGYYTAQIGADAASNHALPFLYPSAKPGLPNVVACTGQTLALPNGKYKAVHLLAAAAGPAAATSFTAQYGGDSAPLLVTIGDWGAAPSGSAPAFTAAYRYTLTGAKAEPATLGDYALPLDPSKKLTALTLPNDRSIKIVAITLEKE